jgi:hypothetical protein
MNIAQSKKDWVLELALFRGAGRCLERFVEDVKFSSWRKKGDIGMEQEDDREVKRAELEPSSI